MANAYSPLRGGGEWIGGERERGGRGEGKVGGKGEGREGRGKRGEGVDQRNRES